MTDNINMPALMNAEKLPDRKADNELISTTERFLAVERPFVGMVLDPCCGQRDIAKAFSHFRGSGISSLDISDGYDFRDTIPQLGHELVSVVSQPTYDQAQELADLALKHTKDRVCLFLKLSFLEGRKHSQWIKETPLSRVWIFSDRATSETAYAWFVWERGHVGRPQIDWIPPLIPHNEAL
ncbi:hypothetical protein GS501_00105 [Saccharibacter sp. 17.LH.SD]|uniref:hypothetical protein n=1 Tax=Saccharibacter sp. 17.LH.SD TaxID=2689393 RepID=UPI00136A1C02|nr:hypothetical protein [Saccharibacter sp. 17.LH.SD]MXV43483.1 hypothetical protein [Saccharibacter sp. 17.LH.SD]